MKINVECTRDVILHIEEHLKYDGTVESELIVALPKFDKYKADDIRYAIKQLCKENMLEYVRNVDKKSISHKEGIIRFTMSIPKDISFAT